MNKGAEVLRLRELGLSNKQIAEALHMPVPSVRRLASEAKVSATTAQAERIYRDQYEQHLMNEALREWANGFKYESKPQRKAKVLVIPDTQVRPGVPTEHLLWIGRYIKEQQPDAVVHLGDHYDLPSLSSYEGKGSKWFEGKTYMADVEAGNRGLELIEEGLGGFKPARKVLLRGNHENRGDRAVNADPRLEGLIGEHLYNDVKLGWEIVPFLKPIEIHSLTFSHFFQNPGTGRPYSGNVETMLKNIGFSFVAGHQQGLRWGRRELTNGRVQIGLIAGSCYLHNEEYRGYQAASEWRGVAVLHEVADGNYDPMFVSLNYLKEKFS